MSVKRVEDLLALTADLQMFYPEDDDLTRRIERCGDAELSMDDLDLVAAAAANPNYKKFLENAKRIK